MSDDVLYEVTIRDDHLLGPCLGERIVDITQHDRDEYDADGEAYVCLHLGNGYTIRFPVQTSFTIMPPTYDDEPPAEEHADV